MRSAARGETSTPAMVTQESDTVQSHRKTCDWKGDSGGGSREQHASLGPGSGESQGIHAPVFIPYGRAWSWGPPPKLPRQGTGEQGRAPGAGAPPCTPPRRRGSGRPAPLTQRPAGALAQPRKSPLAPEAPGGGRGRPLWQPLKGVVFPAPRPSSVRVGWWGLVFI